MDNSPLPVEKRAPRSHFSLWKRHLNWVCPDRHAASRVAANNVHSRLELCRNWGKSRRVEQTLSL